MKLSEREKIFHRRSLIIFTAFIIVAILSAIFIFICREKADQSVKEQANRIAICEDLTDENECFSSEACEGIFGPSCPDCQDLEFKRCQRVPLKAAVMLANEKKLCEDTAGKWSRNKYGSYCACQPGVVYDKDQGCLNK